MTISRDEALELLRGGPDGISKWNAARSSVRDEPRLDLSGADLRGTALRGAWLGHIDLQGADLERANLFRAHVEDADLSGANFVQASLIGTSIGWSNLEGADFSGSTLSVARFVMSELKGANFAGSTFRLTMIDAELNEVEGLTSVLHLAPSMLSNRTLTSLAAAPPEAFLRGVGYAPWEIEELRLRDPDLSPTEIAEVQNRVFSLRSDSILQLRPIFLSYSHQDGEFVNALQGALHDESINTWRDVHDATAGPLEAQVEAALEDRLILVVLSENSLRSRWVKHEVMSACELADSQDRHVLVPIALDDAWTRAEWPARFLRDVKEYNVLDFSDWRQSTAFESVFRRLIAGLRRWYS